MGELRVCGRELLTCPCERQSEREPSSEGSVGGLALKSGRAVGLQIFFCEHPRGRVPLVACWSLAVPVLGATILTPLLIRALSQPLRPGPWTAEFGALGPPHSGPVVSCQPAKSERPGASGSPGLGLAQPALLGPRRARGASCGPKRGGCMDTVAESDQGAAGTLSPSRCPPGLSLAGHETQISEIKIKMAAAGTYRRADPHGNLPEPAEKSLGPQNAGSNLHNSDQPRLWD